MPRCLHGPHMARLRSHLGSWLRNEMCSEPVRKLRMLALERLRLTDAIEMQLG